jgi:hypothetical protein
MSLEKDFILIEGQRNRIKDEWELDLEDKVREEMLDIFDCTIGSFSSKEIPLSGVAKVVTLTAVSTQSLEATRAVSRAMVHHTAEHLKNFCNMIYRIAEMKIYEDVDLTVKIAETFERCCKEGDLSGGWTRLIGDVYVSNPNFINLAINMLDLTSNLPFKSQIKAINLIVKIRNQDYSQDALESLSRTINAYGDSPHFDDVISTLNSTTRWAHNQVMKKDVADLLYHLRDNPKVKDVADIINENASKDYTDRLVTMFSNCSDIYNLNKGNLMSYLQNIIPYLRTVEFYYKLPMRTINNVVKTHSLIMNIFDGKNSTPQMNAEQIFVKILYEKTKLGSTDQEKIQILDEWSTNAYQLIKDHDEDLRHMIPKDNVSLLGVLTI